MTALSAGALAGASPAAAAGVGPNQWGYELVSPADGRSDDIYGLLVSSDMSTVFTAVYNRPLVEGDPADGRNVFYLNAVTPGGSPWPIGPFDFRIGPQLGSSYRYWMSDDGKRVLDKSYLLSEPGGVERQVGGDLGGGFVTMAPTPDMTAFALQAYSNKTVYLARPGQPTIPVSVDASGTPIAATNLGDGKEMPDPYVSSAISADGSSVIYATTHAFAGDNDGGKRDIVRRVVTPGAEKTVVISDATSGAGADAAADADFRWATADHSRVFFVTSEKLVSDDTDAWADLYVRDGDGASAPVRVSKGEVIGGVETGNSPVEVRFVAASADGNRVYFQTAEVLAPGATAPNVFIYERDLSEGRTRLVAAGADWTVPGGGLPGMESVRVIPDGLVFQDSQRLTPDAVAGAPATGLKIYRWTRQGGLEWVSKPAPGAPTPVATATFKTQPATQNPGAPELRTFGGGRSVTDDGSTVFFTTTDSLVAEDKDSGKKDVYRWKAGEGVRLVSLPGRGQYDSTYLDSSPDGKQVYINTAEGLLSEDIDPDAADIYLAILGGGSAPSKPLPDADPEVCTGEACQGPISRGGPLPGIGSVDFAGAGNLLGSSEPVRASVSVGKVKAVHGSRVTLRVKVSVKGRVWVSGSGLVRTSKTAKKAGTYRVSVKLSQRAKRTLKRKHRVRVRAAVRLTPQQGGSVVKWVSVTFKQSAAKKGGR